MISYDVRSRDLGSIFISFQSHERALAEEWYSRYYLGMKEDDSRYGHVLVKSTWETEAEANERRMEWLERQIALSGGRVDLDLPEGTGTLKDYIDSLNKPDLKNEVICDYFKEAGLKEVGV